MKTKRNKRQSKMTLILRSYGSYIDDARQIENLLKKKPTQLLIEMFGAGELPAAATFLLRSALLTRSLNTRIVTHARTHLRGGGVLIWLMGDKRIIREDAKLYFRAAGIFATQENGGFDWTDRDFFFGNDDLEKADYIRVLESINEYLEVKELAGRAIDLSELKQFGLVDNAGMDKFLATIFRREKTVGENPRAAPKRKIVKETNR
jgi:hypothetical protein